jgi:hypothetical protein
MMRVVTVVQQIMTELSGAVSEEDKIVAITKIVSNLMKQADHKSSQAPQSLSIQCKWYWEAGL